MAQGLRYTKDTHTVTGRNPSDLTKNENRLICLCQKAFDTTDKLLERLEMYGVRQTAHS